MERFYGCKFGSVKLRDLEDEVPRLWVQLRLGMDTMRQVKYHVKYGWRAGTLILNGNKWDIRRIMGSTGLGVFYDINKGYGDGTEAEGLRGGDVVLRVARLVSLCWTVSSGVPDMYSGKRVDGGEKVVDWG